MGNNKKARSVYHEEVCKRLAEGTLTDAYKLFHENTKLVYYIVNKKYRYLHCIAMDVEDILQEGFLGLWMACLKFDPSKGFEFATYATRMIETVILTAYRSLSLPLKVPRSFKTIQTLLHQYNFTIPLTEEQMDILVATGKISKKNLLEYTDVEFLCLEDTVKDSEGITYSDMIADPDSLKKYEELEELEVSAAEDGIDIILSYLKPSYRDLVEEWLYSILVDGEALSQRQLAHKYKLSQGYVSRILKYAIVVAKENREEILKFMGLG